MKRRTVTARRLTAEELTSLYESNRAAFPSSEGLRNFLAQYGYDVVDALRARHWLRRGQPADYRWFPGEEDRFSFDDEMETHA